MKKSTFIPIILLLSCVDITKAGDNLTKAAIYKIKSEVLPEEFTEALTDHIESKLIGYPGYRVISRSNLDVLITEDNLSQSGITGDEVLVVEKRNRLTVNKICTGSIGRIGKSYSFTLKMIDVQSGRIDAAAQEIYTGTAEGLLEVGSNLLEQIVTLRSAGKKSAFLSVSKQSKKDSTKTIEFPSTTNKKEVPQPLTKASQQTHPTVVNTTRSVPDAVTDTPTEKKTSKLGKHISIGAVVIFGTLAALVLLTRNN